MKIRTLPGATIDSIKAKLIDYDIEQCKTIIVHVGGNDADNGVDLETFSEKYESLLNIVSDGTRRVIVSELLPRETVDLKPYNETLKSLCADNAVEFVENYDSFLLANGDMPDSYYYNDKVHISATGTRRLLNNISELHQITRPYSASRHHSYTQRSGYGFRRRPNNTDFRGHGYDTKYCHICSRNGHSTQECWYNGRNSSHTNLSLR